MTATQLATRTNVSSERLSELDALLNSPGPIRAQVSLRMARRLIQRAKRSIIADPRWASPQNKLSDALNRLLPDVLVSDPFDKRFLQGIDQLASDPLFLHDALSKLCVITISQSTIHNERNSEQKEAAILKAHGIVDGIRDKAKRINVIDLALRDMYFRLSSLRHGVRGKDGNIVGSDLESILIKIFSDTLQSMSHRKPDGTVELDRKAQADAITSEVNKTLTYGIVPSYSGVNSEAYRRARVDAMVSAQSGIYSLEARTAMQKRLEEDDRRPEIAVRLKGPT